MSAKISEDAVKKATGKTWEQWRKLLKKSVKKDMNHKEIVTLLRDKYELSHWWAQTVTVDFEQFAGRRKVGQTQDANYQIGVRKTVEGSVEEIWELLMSNRGSTHWLGEHSIKTFEKGTEFETKDGKSGEIRVFKPYEHIRLTWKLKDWDRPSTLQIRAIPASSGKTTISFHQEKLSDGKMRERMREHWKGVLDKIEELL